jgi:hypothetical protein
VCGKLFNILQESDMPPTSQTIVAAKEAIANFKILQAKWAAQKVYIDMAEK